MIRWTGLFALCVGACGSTDVSPTSASPDEAPVRSEANVEAPAPLSAWSISPQRVRYDIADGTMVLDAIATEDGPERTDPVWLGATLITTTGEELDLAVKTVFPPQGPGPHEHRISLLAEFEAGTPVKDLVLGVWNTQIRPCEGTSAGARSGCQAYGFLLDDPVASWPAGFYQTGHRQRVLTAAWRIQPVIGVGAGQDAMAALGALRDQATALAQPFGVQVVIEPPRFATAAADKTAIAFSAPHDRPLATQLAAGLNGVLITKGDTPQTHGAPSDLRSTADLVVVLGAAGQPSSATDCLTACAEAGAAAWPECLPPACKAP